MISLPMQNTWQGNPVKLFQPQLNWKGFEPYDGSRISNRLERTSLPCGRGLSPQIIDVDGFTVIFRDYLETGRSTILGFQLLEVGKGPFK